MAGQKEDSASSPGDHIPSPKEYIPSPKDWVEDHVRRYVESNGEDGHDFNGVLCCIVTTHGRKSGKLRRTPLIYGREGDDVIVVASKAGNPHHPHWYLNLLADPRARVQIQAESWDVVARLAGAEEKPALWEKMSEIYPEYREYQTKTDRDIPVVILERSAS